MQLHELFEALLDVPLLRLPFENTEAIHRESFHLVALHLYKISISDNFPLGIITDMSLIDVDFFNQLIMKIPRVQQ